MKLLSKCPAYQCRMLHQLSQLIQWNHNSFVKSDFYNRTLAAPLEVYNIREIDIYFRELYLDLDLDLDLDLVSPPKTWCDYTESCTFKDSSE